MDNVEFEMNVEKMKNIVKIKCELAKFLRENNVDIRSCLDENNKTHIEIYYDFYKDGDPILLYSTKNKVVDEMNVLLGEDLV